EFSFLTNSLRILAVIKGSFAGANKVDPGSIVYFGETDHPIPWQTDHLNCWRTDAANAVEAFTKIVI
ncbi:MAG: hypothetical protein ABI166_03195, partial [Mucilaginibacter sp.]